MPLGQDEERQISEKGGPRIGVSGPEDFSLRYAKLYLNNKQRLYTGDVVLVDPGAAQNMNCDHVIDNAECGFFPFNTWSTCVTIKNLTDNEGVGSKVSAADGEVGQGNPTITIGKVTKPTQFRIRVWANQESFLTVSPPPVSSW